MPRAVLAHRYWGGKFTARRTPNNKAFFTAPPSKHRVIIYHEREDDSSNSEFSLRSNSVTAPATVGLAENRLLEKGLFVGETSDIFDGDAGNFTKRFMC